MKVKECKGCGCDRVLTMIVKLWNADKEIGATTHRICVPCLLGMLGLLKHGVFDLTTAMACMEDLEESADRRGMDANIKA